MRTLKIIIGLAPPELASWLWLLSLRDNTYTVQALILGLVRLTAAGAALTGPREVGQCRLSSQQPAVGLVIDACWEIILDYSPS